MERYLAKWFVCVLLSVNLFIFQRVYGLFTTSQLKYPGKFNSPEDLTSLALRDQEIYRLMKIRVKILKEELYLMERYVRDYEDSTIKGTAHLGDDADSQIIASTVSSNPLMSFRMIKRFSNDLQDIRNYIRHSLYTNDLEHVLELNNSTSSWPNGNDTMIFMEGLLRIHDVYNYNLTEFTAGNIGGVLTEVALSAADIARIGIFGVEIGYYALAVEWLEEAKRQVLELEQDNIRVDVIDSALHLAIKTHDDAWIRYPKYDPKFFLTPVNYTTNQTSTRKKRRTEQLHYFKGNKTSNFNFINYWALCSGENLQSEKEKSELHCWYDTESHLSWKINPLKVELLSKDPLLLQFYDVLGNSLIDEVITKAKSAMKPSYVATRDDNGAISKFRTSTNSWLKDNKNTSLFSIPKRIEYITGLELCHHQAAEDLQVASYIFGKHYDCHLDSLEEGDQKRYSLFERGNRVATFLFYLNEVPLGGFTAFPQAGTFVRPIKGSAVLWYNLYRNGTVNSRTTWHCACPVVLGHKWIANKWIRYKEQFLTRPCTLNQLE